MSNQTIEKLSLDVTLDSSNFDSSVDKTIDKNKKLEKSLENTEKGAKESGKGLKDLSEKQKKTEKSTDNLVKGLGKATKSLVTFFGAVMIGTGLSKLVNEVAKANSELLFLEKNLNMNAKTIRSWQGAAMASGGTAEGMTNSLNNLKQSMNGLVMFGDTSMLPYFNALGVNVVGANGKLRDLNDVMLDIASAFEKMPRDQAYTLAKQMGFDEGTTNTLLAGKKELQEMLAIQDKMYKSDKKSLEASRELAKQQAIANAHWESFKMMIADMLIPVLVRLMKWINGLFEYMQRNEKTIKNVFEAAAIVIGVLLIPMLKAALVPLLAFIAPFAPFILVVAALGAAFVALYDDYKTWADGGKSLFDWGVFIKYIDDATKATIRLKDSFVELTKPMYDAIDKAFPKFTNKVGEYSVAIMAALGHEPSKEALETMANADVNGGVYVPPSSGGKAKGSGGSLGGDTYSKQSYKSKNFTPEKASSIARVAKNIGVDPNDLAAVISFETGGSFNPNIRNPKSSATGLIQFMSGSGGAKGKYYGMSRDQFGSLPFDEQMKYVEKYFRERGFNGKKKRDVADTYTAVTGYGYKMGSKEYELNKVWDSNKDGYIDKGEMVKNPSFKAHQRKYYSNEPSLHEQAIKAQNMVSYGSNPLSGNNTKNDNRKYTDVKIGDIKIQTSSNTVGGNVGEALKATTSHLTQIGVTVS